MMSLFIFCTYLNGVIINIPYVNTGEQYNFSFKWCHMSGKAEKQSIGSFPEIKNKQVKIISIDKRNERQKKQTQTTVLFA